MALEPLTLMEPEAHTLALGTVGMLWEERAWPTFHSSRQAMPANSTVCPKLVLVISCLLSCSVPIG